MEKSLMRKSAQWLAWLEDRKVSFALGFLNGGPVNILDRQLEIELDRQTPAGIGKTKIMREHVENSEEKVIIALLTYKLLDEVKKKDT